MYDFYVSLKISITSFFCLKQSQAMPLAPNARCQVCKFQGPSSSFSTNCNDLPWIAVPSHVLFALFLVARCLTRQLNGVITCRRGCRTLLIRNQVRLGFQLKSLELFIRSQRGLHLQKKRLRFFTYVSRNFYARI